MEFCALRYDSGDNGGDMSAKLTIRPLTPGRWDDLKDLFGARGACGGCWCMWWRLKRREFEERQGDGNRRAMKELVEAGNVPGILGYRDGKPVAWCSVAPREDFGALERSRVLKRLDEEPVWSIVCFFVARGHRGRGALRSLIRAAVDHVRRQGGTVLEAYPSVPRSGRLPPISSFMGLPEVFAEAGFVECARPSASKRILRYYIG